VFYLIAEYSDRTCSRHFGRAKPHCRQPCRQVQNEYLRTGHDCLAQHGHVKPVRSGGRDFEPGTEHRAECARHHSNAEALCNNCFRNDDCYILNLLLRYIPMNRARKLCKQWRIYGEEGLGVFTVIRKYLNILNFKRLDSK